MHLKAKQDSERAETAEDEDKEGRVRIQIIQHLLRKEFGLFF